VTSSKKQRTRVILEEMEGGIEKRLPDSRPQVRRELRILIADSMQQIVDRWLDRKGVRERVATVNKRIEVEGLVSNEKMAVDIDTNGHRHKLRLEPAKKNLREDLPRETIVQNREKQRFPRFGGRDDTRARNNGIASFTGSCKRFAIFGKRSRGKPLK
jgi:hypothetical protein